MANYGGIILALNKFLASMRVDGWSEIMYRLLIAKVTSPMAENFSFNIIFLRKLSCKGRGQMERCLFFLEMTWVDKVGIYKITIHIFL